NSKISLSRAPGARALAGRGKSIVAVARPAYNRRWNEAILIPGRGRGDQPMGVYFLRPRVSDLVFQLYGRPLHPELFDILALRKIQREDYELTVRITRTGHVISWENRDVHLTEVAAATDQPLPEKRRLLSYRLRGEQSQSIACAYGVH